MCLLPGGMLGGRFPHPGSYSAANWPDAYTLQGPEPCHLQIWGPNGMLGGSEIYLDNSKNNFERNMLDTFFLEFPEEQDCGTPLQKLYIECGSQV